MAITLNLLPPEDVNKTSLGKVLNILKMLNVILLSLFIIFVLGLGGYLIYSNFELKNVTRETEELKSKVTALEKTEQQMVLIKDRIGKIKAIQDTPSTSDFLTKVEPYIKNIGDSSQLSEITADSQRTDYSIVFNSHREMTTYFEGLKSSNVFKSITLTTLSYVLNQGYLATFHIF